MRKTFFMWLLLAIAFFASGQDKTLYTVNMVRPKASMKSAFETSWKKHLDTYHKTDNKRTVYEVMSGPRTGEFHIVEGPIAYADMDTERPNGKAHGLDLEKNFFPMLEDERMNVTYRHDDSASFNGDVKAEKFLVTVTHLKMGTQGGTMRENRRGSKLRAKLIPNDRFSSNTYVQIWQGSKSTIVTIRNLKDGFKELENNYYGPSPLANQPNAFKDAYIKDYGQEAWDARSKLLDDNSNVESREVFIMKLRKDLSSE